MTHWEDIVMQQIEDHGPRFAGNGSGALSDAAWHLAGQGYLEVQYRAGTPYHAMSTAGRAAWLAYRQALLDGRKPVVGG
jgi:hypothetical protein